MKRRERTVCFITDQDKVLLALIEYAPGDQRWNGIGGVIDAGESPEDAVVREMAEETEVIVNQQALINHGAIEAEDICLHIFTAGKWSGKLEIKDSSLKELKWFSFNDVPYSKMWAGNDKWLPQILAGKPI